MFACRSSQKRREWILYLKSRLRPEKYLEALQRLYLQRLGDTRLDFLWEEQQERLAAVTREQSKVFALSAYVECCMKAAMGGVGFGPVWEVGCGALCVPLAALPA